MALEIGAWFKKLFGKVEQPKEEAKGVKNEMSAKEAGELASAALSGGIAVVESSQMPKDRSEEKFKKQEEEKPGFWQRPLGKVIKTAGIVVGAGLVAAGAAAAIGASAPGIVVAGGIIGLLALSGCVKEEEYNFTFSDPVTQTVEIEIINDYQPIIDAINRLIEKLESLGQTLTNNQDYIIKLIKNLLNHLDQYHQSLETLLNNIIEQLETMSQQDQEFHINLLNALNELKEQNETQFNLLMDKLDSIDANLQAGFFNLIGTIVQQGGNISNQVNQLIQQMTQAQQQLDTIIALLGQIDTNMQAGFSALLAQVAAQGDDILAFLDSIAALLQQISTQVQQGNEQNQTLLQAILNKITQLDGHLQAGIAAILAKLDQLDANQQTAVLSILNGLGNIEQNQLTQISQLTDILAAINSGNVQLDNIANLIANLDLGNVDVNLDVIESLLAQIYAQTQANGNILQNMDANIALILATTQTLQQQMAQVINNQEILLDWQENIFNKIPDAVNNCNCSECCAQLIFILQQIDDHIQNHDWNHEGIDDELEGLLNP